MSKIKCHLHYVGQSEVIGISRYFVFFVDGFIIPNEASRIHGITTERAYNEGKDLLTVLQLFQYLNEQADFLVAHNMSFDEKIVGAEFLRNKVANSLASKRKICTMHGTTNFCKLDGPYGYKWPKLSELHYKLFRPGFEEAHNAAIDINATAKCFWELRKLGQI
jgi:DNA polymerase III subunit epsilon